MSRAQRAKDQGGRLRAAERAQESRQRLRSEAIARANRRPMHSSPASSGLAELALLIGMVLLVMVVLWFFLAPELHQLRALTSV
jgi:hypothetical protein